MALTRKTMRLLLLLALLLPVFPLAAGAGGNKGESLDSTGHILVAYFSRTGENYAVGVVKKGSTHIIADMIAEKTGGDLFEIAPVNPYPDVYDKCVDAAKRERAGNARPEILNPPEDLSSYDTVFIGYPIWCGDLPMAVYTFLEKYDFSGKTVIPFCTHEGSGLSGTKSSIERACPGAAVLDGIAVRGREAQNEQKAADANVSDWLEKIGLLSGAAQK